VKPKTLGVLAALVTVPTIAAVVPGHLAVAVAPTAARTRSVHYAATPAVKATAVKATAVKAPVVKAPAVKGGTATLVSVIVTTASDGASSASRDALREPGRRLGAASCSTPGAGTSAYTVTGVRASSTTAHFNPAGSPVSGAASIFQAAFGAWMGAGAPSINVASDGTATRPTADHTYELMFASLGGRTLAVTYSWRWSTGDYESDTVFNSKGPWFVAPGEGSGCYPGVRAYDLQEVATHEFGHTYGLGHVQAPFNTMFPTAALGETFKRSPEIGDRLGIQAVYGG